MSASVATMTAEDLYVRDILSFFYPEDPPEQINDSLRQLASRMLHDAITASKALDLVPRPPGAIPGARWLLSQGVRMFWRRHGRTKIYEMARVTVAMKRRSEYSLARAGQ